MDYNFTYSFSDQEKEEVMKFINSLDYFAFEQLPVWSDIIEENYKPCYFLAKENNNILGFAKIAENINPLLKTAHIQFGPVCENSKLIIESIEKIYTYYKNKNYTELSIQLAIPTGPKADFIEYKLNKKYKIKYFFDKLNWSSITIDLSIPTETILKNFSKGHKSDIKKAITNGLIIKKMPFSNEELDEFAAIYKKMNTVRQLSYDEDKVDHQIKKIYLYLLKEKRGDYYLVKDLNEKVVGGIITLNQGKSIRYFKGASDPERRDLPILHLALWEAIQDAHKNGYKSFDFWGYNHMADETEQVFFINKFKKGFGGEFTFYPKIMHFIFKPINFELYYLIWNLKKVIKKYV